MTMVHEAPSLNPSYEDAIPALSGKGKHGYYKRSPRGNSPGWVTLASSSPNLRLHYEQKGMTYLASYGDFSLGTNDPRSKPQSFDSNGKPWNPAVENFRLLFQLGGAHEFPVDQIIAFKWHLHPPYREVSFPQLDGVTITNFTCPECDGERVFSAVDESEAALALRFHLMSKIDARHEYRPEDLHKLGELESINFFPNRIGRSSVRGGITKTESTGRLPQTKECPECHEIVETQDFKFARHMRAHKQAQKVSP